MNCCLYLQYVMFTGKASSISSPLIRNEVERRNYVMYDNVSDFLRFKVDAMTFFALTFFNVLKLTKFNKNVKQKRSD